MLIMHNKIQKCFLLLKTSTSGVNFNKNKLFFFLNAEFKFTISRIKISKEHKMQLVYWIVIIERLFHPLPDVFYVKKQCVHHSYSLRIWNLMSYRYVCVYGNKKTNCIQICLQSNWKSYSSNLVWVLRHSNFQVEPRISVSNVSFITL